MRTRGAGLGVNTVAGQRVYVWECVEGVDDFHLQTRTNSILTSHIVMSRIASNIPRCNSGHHTEFIEQNPVIDVRLVGSRFRAGHIYREHSIKLSSESQELEVSYSLLGNLGGVRTSLANRKRAGIWSTSVELTTVRYVRSRFKMVL